ncbi:hypothetical protein LINGRAHAP2_LOCUS21676 [Linum grandiflorum]
MEMRCSSETMLRLRFQPRISKASRLIAYTIRMILWRISFITIALALMMLGSLMSRRRLLVPTTFPAEFRIAICRLLFGFSLL